MTMFTDAQAALDEAKWLAEKEDKPQAIVRQGDAMAVMSYTDAWYERREILETVNPVGGI